MNPDPSTITRVVRAALGDPRAEIASWERTPIEWQAIAPTTAELARYSGTTADGRGWSAIRKVIRKADSRETVAIDWSLLGLAPAGQEIAVFVTGTRVWLSLGPADAAALGELSFHSYLDGLRDAGWTGSEAEIRFAYAASAALWAGIPAPVWLRWFTLPARRKWLERKFGMTLEDAAEPFGAFIGYALDLGDEALAATPV